MLIMLLQALYHKQKRQRSTGWTYTNQGANEREGPCTRRGNGTNISSGRTAMTMTTSSLIALYAI